MADLTVVFPVLGVLATLTNIIVQVAKKATCDKLPTSVVALLVAQALTAAAGIAYCQINAVAMSWYIAAALVAGGFVVAYAAMFGYDKLLEILQWRENR